MKSNVVTDAYFFTNKELRKLVIPLIIEQFLAVLVGLCDSIMVAGVSEAAVSGVSLVDTLSILLIQLFAALATGGAVIAGQFLGKKKTDKACQATDQIMFITVAIGIVITALVYLLKNTIIDVIFGSITAEVRYNCNLYYMITMASIPFLALYNVGAAIFRVMGNSKITMYISLLMNGINIAGNAVMIYGLKSGVEGAAIPTLVSRVIAAIIIIVLLINPNRLLHFSRPFKVRIIPHMAKNILFIAIPNGFENTIFHIGKIIVLSMVASFGTASIAANAVCNMLSNFMTLPGVAINAALLPVVARCVGAGDYKQVKYYTKKLISWAYIILIILNAVIMAMLPLILYVYGLSEEATEMARRMIYYEVFCVITAWPLSFMIANTLRASNDVKFCMITSIITMWTARIGTSWFLGVYLGWGVFGVWVGMTIDWFVRAVCFMARYFSGRWKIIKEIN